MKSNGKNCIIIYFRWSNVRKMLVVGVIKDGIIYDKG
jgi:hypothetical protein